MLSEVSPASLVMLGHLPSWFDVATAEPVFASSGSDPVVVVSEYLRDRSVPTPESIGPAELWAPGIWVVQWTWRDAGESSWHGVVAVREVEGGLAVVASTSAFLDVSGLVIEQRRLTGAIETLVRAETVSIDLLSLDRSRLALPFDRDLPVEQLPLLPEGNLARGIRSPDVVQLQFPLASGEPFVFYAAHIGGTVLSLTEFVVEPLGRVCGDPIAWLPPHWYDLVEVPSWPPGEPCSSAQIDVYVADVATSTSFADQLEALFEVDERATGIHVVSWSTADYAACAVAPAWLVEDVGARARPAVRRCSASESSAEGERDDGPVGFSPRPPGEVLVAVAVSGRGTQGEALVDSLAACLAAAPSRGFPRRAISTTHLAVCSRPRRSPRRPGSTCERSIPGIRVVGSAGS